MSREVEEPVVRIRGIPWKATKDQVEALFEDCGLANETDNIVLVELRGRPSGVAYVRLEDIEGAKKALTKNGKYIEDRYVEVFPSTISEMNFFASRDPYVLKLFGVPFHCSKKDMMEFFEGFEVREEGILLVKGVAYVKFNSEEDVVKAVLTKDGNELLGRVINISLTGAREVEREVKSRRTAFDEPFVEVENVLLMRGLPFKVTKKEIQDWFSDAATPVRISVRDGRGEALFASEAEMERALTKHMAYMGRRYIELVKKSDSIRGGGFGGGGGGGKRRGESVHGFDRNVVNFSALGTTPFSAAVYGLTSRIREMHLKIREIPKLPILKPSGSLITCSRLLGLVRRRPILSAPLSLCALLIHHPLK